MGIEVAEGDRVERARINRDVGACHRRSYRSGPPQARHGRVVRAAVAEHGRPRQLAAQQLAAIATAAQKKRDDAAAALSACALSCATSAANSASLAATP